MIDFSHKNTRNVAISLYKRMIQNKYKFQTLTLFTGFGKTAISVATAGIYAIHFKQDINVFIIAPRTKLDDGSWEKTIDEYNKIAKYKLNILDKSDRKSTHLNSSHVTISYAFFCLNKINKS